MEEAAAPQATGNDLLDRLAPETLAALVEASRPVHLPQRDTLWQPGGRVDHVYFPLTGVVSLLAMTSEGASVEVATVGHEGMVGLPAFLGQRHRAPGCALSQIPGEGLLIDADRFQAIVAGHRAFGDLLRRYTNAILIHVTQGAICNRLHSVEQRLVRWILEMDDRIGPEELPVTHEFLALMLGVRRASVTEAVAQLERGGALAHERGRIRVLDHDGLAARACECYSVVRQAYDDLLDGGAPGPDA
ncbi:MAG TPA: Crp/Fnr family transcriptional regulator [Actinomycetota bacterium]|nr:Crp/Fnr family transcriptional regulator [Actinomycetota bacterium]